MLSLFTSVALASALTTGEPPAPAKPTAVRFRVDVSGLAEREPGITTELLQTEVRDAGMDELMTEHHATLVDNATAAQIVVVLSWAQYDETSGNAVHRIVIQVNRPGEEPRELEPIECAQCVNEQITSKVLQGLNAAMAELAPVPVEDPGTLPEADNPPSEPEGPTNPDPSGKEPKKGRAIGALGIVGIVAAGGGIGMAGYGGSLLAKGDVQSVPDNEQDLQARDHAPPGRAWIGAGVGLAVVGATALVVDLTVLRKKRQRTAAVTPTVSGSMLGLMATGRF